MEMADIIMILVPGQADRLGDDDLALCFAATNVERPIEGAVACTVPADKVDEIARHPAIAYLRRVQAYTGSADS